MAISTAKRLDEISDRLTRIEERLSRLEQGMDTLVFRMVAVRTHFADVPAEGQPVEEPDEKARYNLA